MADVNGFDPVPMFIADQALHSADVVRNLIYNATGGGGGVSAPGDLKVTALGTPGARVQIAPGSITIPNRSPGGAQQSYTGRAPNQGFLDIAPTGSGAGRTDYIVGRVEDPQFAPWVPYGTTAAKRVGPYIYPRVLAGLSPTIKRAEQLPAPYNTQSIEILARVTLPPSTATVTNAHITDLRRMPQPKNHRGLERATVTVEDAMVQEPGRIWPDFNPTIPIPSWAVGCVTRCDIFNLGLRPGPVNTGGSQGIFTIVLGGIRAENTSWDLDRPVQGGSRINLATTGVFDVRSLAGQDVEARMEARVVNWSTGGPNQSYLVTVAGTQMIWDFTFFERPI
jgi:hypothetical protein